MTTICPTIRVDCRDKSLHDLVATDPLAEKIFRALQFMQPKKREHLARWTDDALILFFLALDEDFHVRYNAAWNPRTPNQAVLVLSRDPVGSVRRMACGNENLPSETVPDMLSDPDLTVRLVAEAVLNGTFKHGGEPYSFPRSHLARSLRKQAEKL